MTQTGKSKPEVEFQHGRHLITEAESSNISAMDREISPKFGMQVDIDTKSEVKLRCRGPPS